VEKTRHPQGKPIAACRTFLPEKAKARQAFSRTGMGFRAFVMGRQEYCIDTHELFVGSEKRIMFACFLSRVCLLSGTECRIVSIR